MHTFRDGPLVFDNQLMCPSLGKTISPAPSTPRLSVVLCAGLMPHKLYPISITMSLIVTLVQVV